ncbi:hypothetical protein H6CHR_05350 [Variovorax sp. PBL-H6]|nr:hypothetical protein H6CHR_05350 [Variovorax sp. PBL-H6]
MNIPTPAQATASCAAIISSEHNGPGRRWLGALK